MFDEKQEAFAAFRDIIAERTNPVLIWVGSGVSAGAALPVWSELNERLCRSLEEKATGLSTEEDVQTALSHLTFAQKEKNYWLAFRALKEGLGATTFREIVRAALRPAETCPIPPFYEAMWKLPISGVLSLNLDRLATRSHSSARPGKNVHEFAGRDAAQRVHLLRGSQPFVANLHGIVEDESTWVLTYDELKGLLDSPGYRDFISACLATRTILFVGISADDSAAGGHLESLRQRGVDFGSHFWVTDRRDGITHQWAEKAGVRLIKYKNTDGKHSELDDMVKYLLDYLPKDPDPVPVSSSFTGGAPSESLPAPEILATYEAERIRLLLNAQASMILNSGIPEKYDKYKEFCKKYDEAIYRAWYVNMAEPKNMVLGYKVIERIARGAFGTVYRALDKNNSNVAIKILHEEVRNQPEMLQSFRRGVNSMSILSNHHLEGVVPYRDASEIPALVAMDFIEGPSLNEAVKAQRVKEWASVLRVAAELAKIIRASHRLPERVLHRDIRPSNIMLQNGWNEEEEWEVVVLDFDLSWHRDAQELSVQASGTGSGYLAPEQVLRNPSVPTRSAAVDSYGTGMTLFFLRTASEPVPFQHRHSEWQKTLDTSAERFGCREWRSLPRRYFRLVEFSTREQQTQRWDMSQIQGELIRLAEAIQKPEGVSSAELLAEELAFRSFDGAYSWNPDRLVARSEQLPLGYVALLEALESEGKISLTLGWKQTGTGKHSSVRKWVPDAFQRALSILKKANWKDAGSTRGAYEMGIQTLVDTFYARGHLEELRESICKALSELEFNK